MRTIILKVLQVLKNPESDNGLTSYFTTASEAYSKINDK